MTIFYFSICAIALMAILYPWRNYKANQQFRKNLGPGDIAIYKVQGEAVEIRVATIVDETVICYPSNSPDQRLYANIQNVYPI